MAFYEKVTTQETMRRIGRKSYPHKAAVLIHCGEVSIRSAELTVDEVEDYAKHLLWTAKQMRRGEKALKRLEAKEQGAT